MQSTMGTVTARQNAICLNSFYSSQHLTITFLRRSSGMEIVFHRFYVSIGKSL